MKRVYSFLLVFVLFAVVSVAQSIRVHEPVMAEQNGRYYLFCTGWGISVWSSTDMKEWEREKPVFSQPLEWAVEAVKDFKGHIWAPDISFYNGKYYLYYSVSSFGKNTSCIGLVTKKEFPWTAEEAQYC